MPYFDEKPIHTINKHSFWVKWKQKDNTQLDFHPPWTHDSSWTNAMLFPFSLLLVCNQSQIRYHLSDCEFCGVHSSLGRIIWNNLSVEKGWFFFCRWQVSSRWQLWAAKINYVPSSECDAMMIVDLEMRIISDRSILWNICAILCGFEILFMTGMCYCPKFHFQHWSI